MTDAKDLRDLWKRANDLARAAEVAAAEYNLALTKALMERNAPPGFSLDLHGDGKLKPARECAPPSVKDA